MASASEVNKEDFCSRLGELDIQSDSLQEKLGSLECHFTWKLEEFLDERFSIKRLLEGLKDKEATPVTDSDTRFRLLLDISFWSFYCQDYDGSEDSHNKAYDLSNNLPERLHICLGLKAHFLSKKKDSNSESIETLLHKIIPFSELTNKQKSFIYGIRGESTAVVGDKARDESLAQYKKANILDDSDFRWYLGIGKTLRRIRKITMPFHSPACEEEIDNFSKAVNRGAPRLFLAGSLSDFAYVLHTLDHNKYKQKIWDINEEASNLIKQILIKDEAKSAEDYLSCGEILRRFPKPFQNLQLAQHCFNKALKLEPDNSKINHKYGKFIEKSDPYKALIHFEKAFTNEKAYNKSAHMDYVRLKCDLDPAFDPEAYFQNMLKRYISSLHKAEIYAQRADFLREVDPEKAVELYRASIALGKCEHEDWGKKVFKFNWLLKSDGRRVRIKERCSWHNLFDVVNELESNIKKVEEQ